MNKNFKDKKHTNKPHNTQNTQNQNSSSGNRPGVQYRQVGPKQNESQAQSPAHVKKPQAKPAYPIRRPEAQPQPVRRRVEAPKESAQDTARRRALEAQRKRAEKKQRAENFRHFIKTLVTVTVLSLIGGAICLCAIVFLLARDFNKADSGKVFPVEIVIDGNEEKAVILSSSDYSYAYGEYYVSLPALSKHLDFSILGDVKNMTLSASVNDNAEFYVGSTQACINGNNILLEQKTYFSNGALFIPVSFLSDYCADTRVEATKGKNGRVYRIDTPKALEFLCKKSSPTESIPVTQLSMAAGIRIPEFVTDLSEYEMYMNPENRDEYLVLINTSNMLESDYIPTDLTDFIYTRKDRSAQKLRLYAAKSLEAMFKEMYAAGYTDVTVTSGYRSYDYQTVLFNNEVASWRPIYGDNAESKAAEAIAIPGSSEHQSGLCADLHNLSAASTAFEKQDAYKWLYANCADFGFILRFPKDKTEITGIMFEPWHYRFVGRYHAQKIMSSGLCLEEYMEEYKGN